jgi:hypothetical protein
MRTSTTHFTGKFIGPQPPNIESGIDDDTHICTSVLDNDADSKYYRLVFLKQFPKTLCNFINFA